MRVQTETKHAEEIHFAIGESSLGLVLVAQGDGGVRAVLIGDDRDALRNDLQRRFPRATLVADNADAVGVAGRVIEYIEAPARGLDVTMDMRGSEFQLEVWRALRNIPAGRIATYTDVANSIGRPHAVRAVAAACAANPLAVVVPCHRVVRRDGGLAGYRWGIERKRALLDRESPLEGRGINSPLAIASRSRSSARRCAPPAP